MSQNTFVLRCVFDSAQFKLLISTDCLFFLTSFHELACQNIHERYDRHYETHWTTVYRLTELSDLF